MVIKHPGDIDDIQEIIKIKELDFKEKRNEDNCDIDFLLQYGKYQVIRVWFLGILLGKDKLVSTKLSIEPHKADLLGSQLASYFIQTAI